MKHFLISRNNLLHQTKRLIDVSSRLVHRSQAELPARARAALGKEVVDKYYADQAEKVLAPVSKFLERKGLAIKRIVKIGPAGAAIGKVADGGKYDLLVMGSHGHGALATLVMGSVTTQVLANSRVPVLIVR